MVICSLQSGALDVTVHHGPADKMFLLRKRSRITSKRYRHAHVPDPQQIEVIDLGIFYEGPREDRLHHVKLTFPQQNNMLF